VFAKNAGPIEMIKLRHEARENGLDPNVWFRNLEIVAAKRMGREAAQYVSSICKYYVAYRLIANELALKEDAKASF
jgi:membrane-bound lytic murein transglycosylase MltF